MILKLKKWDNFEKKNMKDTDFEVDSMVNPLKFETFSEGFSNIGMPGYTPEQEKEFNRRYLEYLREVAGQME